MSSTTEKRKIKLIQVGSEPIEIEVDGDETVADLLDRAGLSNNTVYHNGGEISPSTPVSEITGESLALIPNVKGGNS